MRSLFRSRRSLRSLALALLLPTASMSASLAAADTLDPSADRTETRAAEGSVDVLATSDALVVSAVLSAYELRIAGAGSVHRVAVEAGETAAIAPVDASGTPWPDGIYVWEAIPQGAALESRAGDRTLATAGSRRTGSFHVIGGGLVASKEAAEPKGSEPSTLDGLPTKDQVITDDLIVTNEACFGPTCVDGEVFEATVKIDANRPALNFEDSSTAATYTTRDWEIRANDNSSGGLERLRFGDLDANTIPFSILGGAPDDALVVAANGNIGFRAVAPVKSLHLVRGNTPTLRLEQDGSSGFASQTWDIEANEAVWGVEDVTADTSPIRVETDVADYTLYLASEDFVGIGTSAPQSKLAVVDSRSVTSPTSVADLAIAGPPRFSITNTDTNDQWFIGQNTAGAVTFSKRGTATNEMKIDGLDNTTRPGRVTFAGDVYATGFQMTSDRARKHAFEAVDVSTVLQKVAALPISSWSYLGQETRHVGPMAQDFQAAFRLGADDETIGVVDAAGVALAAIQGLHAENAQLRAENAELADRLAALEAAVGELLAAP